MESIACRQSHLLRKDSGTLSMRLERKPKHKINSSPRVQKAKKKAKKTGQVRLNNWHDFAYTAPILLGTDQQEMNMVWDTGSDWLTVEGKYCRACEGNTYWNDASTNFEFLESEQSV